MLVLEVRRVVARVLGKVSLRGRGVLVAPFVPVGLVVLAVATAAYAAPVGPVPVQDDPQVDEGAPTAHGKWFGWAQDSRADPGHDDFYVRRGTAPRVRVNAARAQGLGGGIAGRSVFYLQQRGDNKPRIYRFDLETGRRAPLPAKVNHHRRGGLVHGVRGQATVSGPWLLYSGFIEAATDFDYPTWTVMLYNRVSHQLRQVDGAESDQDNYVAGQVNGRYATYWSYGRHGGSHVYRYDIKTKRTVELPSPGGGEQYDPAVSSDGAVYYFLAGADEPVGGPFTTELVRQPIGGPAEVVTTLTGEDRPEEAYVRDRTDGSRVVFFSWGGDVYKVVATMASGSTQGPEKQ